MADSAVNFSSLTEKKLRLDGLSAEELQELKQLLELWKREVTRLLRAVRKKIRSFESNYNTPAQIATIKRRRPSDISEEEENPEAENVRATNKRTKVQENTSSRLSSGQRRIETLEVKDQTKKARKIQGSSVSGSRRPRVPPYTSVYSPPTDRAYSLRDKIRILQNLDRALELANGQTKAWLLRDLDIQYREGIPVSIQFDFLSIKCLQKVEKFIIYVRHNMQNRGSSNSDEDEDDIDIDIRIITALDLDEDEEEEEEEGGGGGGGQQIEPRGDEVASISPMRHVSYSRSSSSSRSQLESTGNEVASMSPMRHVSYSRSSSSSRKSTSESESNAGTT